LRQGAYRSWAEMERVSLPVGVDVNVVVNGIVDGDGDGDVSEMPQPRRFIRPMGQCRLMWRA
jgi:hypothetical protein